MTHQPKTPHVAVIGAGFCGLAAGYELCRQGIRVTLIEQDEEIGGLAGSFRVNGASLEKFYHHWFTNDEHVMRLVEELGCEENIIRRPTRTGMYYANNFMRLSTPLDLLQFKPLPVLDRIRLGLLALRARRVRDWRQLEKLTAADWLKQMGGDNVYRIVWEPLLRGKFGDYASEVSAVWFWNKLKLRGGSRGKGGEEVLAYYKGGFAALAGRVADEIQNRGGTIETGARVRSLLVRDGQVTGVRTSAGELAADAVIATPALPVIAQLLEPCVAGEYLATLRRIRFLANICLVLELDRSLSETYWLNVNDPGFPFVGIIEHTNFEPPATYGGKHIVYLSKYLLEDDALFRMEDDQAVDYCVPYIQRMFPKFERAWIRQHHVWRARYSQPIVERNYGALIPAAHTPLREFYIATMAQVYPEDRGTNYAIREGRRIGRQVADRLKTAPGSQEADIRRVFRT
ncbi:MAG: NAD(P)/FAD-dependent oxidoreductase [Thiogranum sp.]|nr:NAD(P)/FAD-dependent oxidoreductase [Thiogranum sp.]